MLDVLGHGNEGMMIMIWMRILMRSSNIPKPIIMILNFYDGYEYYVKDDNDEGDNNDDNDDDDHYHDDDIDDDFDDKHHHPLRLAVGRDRATDQ